VAFAGLEPAPERLGQELPQGLEVGILQPEGQGARDRLGGAGRVRPPRQPLAGERVEEHAVVRVGVGVGGGDHGR